MTDPDRSTAPDASSPQVTDAIEGDASGSTGAHGDGSGGDSRRGACVADPGADRSGTGTFAPADGPSDERQGPPDVVAARDHVRESLVRFARSLRRAGAEVPANAATEAARALVQTGFEEGPARAGLRATLVTRQEDLSTFERQFPEFWRRLTAGIDGSGPADRREDAPDGRLAPIGGDPAAGAAPESGSDPGGDADAPDPETPATTMHVSGASGEDGGGEDDPESVTTSVYSKTGAPVPVSVPPATLRVDDDLAGPMRKLTRAIAGLDGRRWAREGTRKPDARRALRESFSTGGTVASVPRRDRKRTAVRATVLVDVSQSVLDTVDRGFLLAVVHRAVAAWRNVRVFFFDEGIREVTGAFDQPTTADAVAALERAETEWGGGTQIGRAFETLRREYPDAVDRDAVTFVVSDGLETGAVEELAENAAWLARRGRALLWCNPLAASLEFEPATRGMAAVLPAVDGVFAFAGPEDVAEMARQIRLHGTGGPIGYEHDHRRREASATNDNDNGDDS